MPRISEKRRLENALSDLLRKELLVSLICDNNAGSSAWPDIAFILAAVRRMRYLRRPAIGTADRVLSTPHHDLIDQLLNSPDASFRARFRMDAGEFETFTSYLQAHSTPQDWHINEDSTAGGHPGRPMRKQVAIALYILGGQEGTLEKVRGVFGVAKGSAYNYLWRTIAVLGRLVPTLIQWPSRDQQRSECAVRRERSKVFAGCIGYVGGRDIVLNEKQQRFDLQSVCDDHCLITYAQMRPRDSSAFKDSSLYRFRTSVFSDDAFFLADKAYEIDKHIITPFPANAAASTVAYQPFNNVALSRRRVRIEHTFAMIKERFASFDCPPMHIRGNQLEYDLNRVQHWTLACVCIHNLLRRRKLSMPIPEGPSAIDLQSNKDAALSADCMREIGEARRMGLAEEVYKRETELRSEEKSVHES